MFKWMNASFSPLWAAFSTFLSRQMNVRPRYITMLVSLIMQVADKGLETFCFAATQLAPFLKHGLRWVSFSCGKRRVSVS